MSEKIHKKKDNDRDLLFLLENKQIELKPSKTQINKCQNFLESIGVNFKENQKIVTIIVRDKAYGLKYKKRDESYIKIIQTITLKIIKKQLNI